jgi:uncharacterized protein (DUF2252 family)
MTRIRGVPKSERAAHLAALKATKMAASMHGYVRARADLFFEVVERHRTIPEGPPIWISGDCHGENIGAVADAEGHARMDLNDLDETAVGLPAHDVLRLALAIVVAARDAGVSGLAAPAIAAAVLDGYTTALERRDPARAVALDDAPPRFLRLLMKTARATRRGLLDRRAPRDARGRRRFLLGPRYLPIDDDERAAIAELVDRREVRTLIASMSDDAPEVPVELVDAAFRVAGTGSLGCFRVAALVRVGAIAPKGKKAEDLRLRLVDVKQALPSRAIRHPRGETPADDAERVVLGARALVPTFGERMIAANVLGFQTVVRELMPQDQKVLLSEVESDEAEPIARYLGSIVGRAHARQLAGDAVAWARELRSGSRRSSPPNWLWEPLVDLVSAHDVAYLRHCGALAERRASEACGSRRRARSSRS